MANSLLSERQWFWVADRIQEGYQIKELEPRYDLSQSDTPWHPQIL